MGARVYVCVPPKQEGSGHIVLLGVFDCVDDTVLVKKAILSVSATLTLNPTKSTTIPSS